MVKKTERPSDTVRGHLYAWLDAQTETVGVEKYPAELERRLSSSRPRERVTEAQQRLDLLFAHFGIPNGDYQQLAIALACRHVGGFQQPRKRGRPPKKKRQQSGKEFAAKFGAIGRAKRGPIRRSDPLEVVESADKWIAEEKARTGRQPSDAAWAKCLLKSQAVELGLRGRKADSYVREELASKKKELSRARDWAREHAKLVRDLIARGILLNY